MNKRGFTLVEIIVVISLLAVIGVGITFAIIKTNEKKRQMELEILVANQDKFQSALDVYLTNHDEIIDNVMNDVEGAIVSLEVLKNEGLISDNMAINYKDNYYVISNSLFYDKKLDDSTIKYNCENNVSLVTVASWLIGEDSSKVLYFCPKKEKEGEEIVYDPYYDKGGCSPNSDGLSTDGRLYCKVINSAMISRPDDEKESNYEYNGPKTININSDQAEKSLNYFDTDDFKNSSDYLYSKTAFREKTLTEDGSLAKVLKTNYKTYNNQLYKFNVESHDRKTKFYRDSTIALGNDNSTGVNCPFQFCSYYNILNYSDVNITTSGNKRALALTGDALTGGKPDPNLYSQASAKLWRREFSKWKENDYFSYSNIIKNMYINNGVSIYKSYGDLIDEVMYENSLYKMQDDFGMSYFYRGDVNDNYINFAGMCWRILRVEGDGSVRIILNNEKGTCNTLVNDVFNSQASIGNSEYGTICTKISCTKDRTAEFELNYDISTAGLKNTLNNFLNSKLSKHKEYIQEKKICLVTPDNNQLKCNSKDDMSEVNYISSIRNEEFQLSGGNLGFVSSMLKNQLSSYYNDTTRNIFNDGVLTISRKDKDYNYLLVNSTYNQNTLNFSVTTEIEYSDDTSIRGYKLSGSTHVVIPTLSLKSSILYKSGDGTITNPYVIE